MVPMFPKRHLMENRSLIFRRLFQTTKNPEVWTVTGFCGFSNPSGKFWADVALSALAPVLWSRGPQLTPAPLPKTVGLRPQVGLGGFGSV